MDFKDNRPIYLQIADYISENILSSHWSEGERIASVREMGATLGVNPNTCMRAYEQLTQQGVIEAQRGMGYSICEGAVEKIRTLRREAFLSSTLPEFVRQMHLLGVTLEQVEQEFRLKK